MTHRLELKAEVAIDDTGTVTGMAWPFGAPDSVGDVIEKGAFTLPRHLPIVMEHDQRQVIGVWEDYAETDAGLEVKGHLFVEGIEPSRSAHDLLRKGRLSGLSLGFVGNSFSPRDGGGRTFTDITVTEISLCRLPVHPGARITAIKAKPAKENELNPEETEHENEIIASPELKAVNDNLANLTSRLDKFEAKANRPVPANDNAEPTEQRKAFGTYLRLGNGAPVEEIKALTVANDEQGGYLAPEEVSQEFIRDLTEFSPVRNYASVRSISSPSVKYPKRTGITNAQWEGEGEDSEESTVTFGQLEVPARKLMTFVDISNELLADSGGSAEREVRMALAEDFGQKEALGFVSGTGTKEPEGFMANADIGHTVNGHATNLNTDKMIDLLYALPAAYRNASGAAWAMNGTTLATVRKLKNATTGEYIWQPSIQAGQPETILGKPVIEMVDMPDVGDGEFPIIFGDWSAYRIVDRLALSILVNPYLLASKGVTRIHATRRVGGKVLQAARFRKLKSATS